MIIIPSNTGTTQIPVEVVSFQDNGIAGYQGDKTWPLPTYSPGDLVVAFMTNFSVAPVPPTASSTVPSFSLATSAGDAGGGLWVYYGYLPNSGMSMGYWNSSYYWCFNYLVLRKTKTSSPIGGAQAQFKTDGSTTATAPAVTLQKSNASSALVSFFHSYNGGALSMSSINAGGFTNHLCNVRTTPDGRGQGMGIFSKTQVTSSEEMTFATYSAGPQYHKSATIEILAA